MRRRFGVLLIGLVALCALLAAVWLAPGEKSDSPGDPGSNAPEGTGALARTLDARGVEVQVVRNAAALRRTRLDRDTTVVVSNGDALGRDAYRSLLARRDGATVVFLGAGPATRAELDLRPRRLGSGAPVDADCRLLKGLSLPPGRSEAYPGRTGCLPTSDGPILAGPRDGIWVFGAPQTLANSRVLDGDNAAIGLRLLGQRERVVWYVADPADQTGADRTGTAALLPPWIKPALILLLLATAATMLWRGRRLGPLVTEPVPVVVHSTESLQARARLYRRAADRAHAARSLREAYRTRLGEDLLADPRGHDPDEIRRLLSPDSPPPADDDELVALATALRGLSAHPTERGPR